MRSDELNHRPGPLHDHQVAPRRERARAMAVASPGFQVRATSMSPASPTDEQEGDSAARNETALRLPPRIRLTIFFMLPQDGIANAGVGSWSGMEVTVTLASREGVVAPSATHSESRPLTRLKQLHECGRERKRRVNRQHKPIAVETVRRGIWRCLGSRSDKVSPRRRDPRARRP